MRLGDLGIILGIVDRRYFNDGLPIESWILFSRSSNIKQSKKAWFVGRQSKPHNRSWKSLIIHHLQGIQYCVASYRCFFDKYRLPSQIFDFLNWKLESLAHFSYTTARENISSILLIITCVYVHAKANWFQKDF